MSPEAIAFVNQALVPCGLALIMFSMGLTLALRDFAAILSGGRAAAAGFATHLLVPPLLGLTVGALFGLPPELALGLFIISICPAGTTSNALTFVGRGNLALAVVLTLMTSVVTVFTIPILLRWAVPWFLGGTGATVPQLDIVSTMGQLARITLAPIALGMVVRRFAPEAAGRIAQRLRPTAFVVLVAVIGFSVVVSFDMVVQNLIAATPAIYALNMAAMAFGLMVGRVLGLNARDRMTLAIETGVQNATLALFLTLTVLESLPLAVTQNIYGMVMLFNASLLIRWFRGRITREAVAA
ncbi:bile acid:Na+ symporter, BASS family [Sphingomonas sp. OV641]|uniref:bile acid:sodium symporter family protein n=1 Tax=Sphingomonas sp. OV641 TaxID=1881068 RepID=UPI0008C98FCA|nr:bile acid:sodium symporter family protein [Sphingomonas sp. OV641]SEI73399.1 bile acid:Na+ symporter, BASS family [Sphingomonas sp. OV641]